MAGVRPQKVLTFTQIDRLLKKELGAVYVDHFDKDCAAWRISSEKQTELELPEEEEDMGLFSKLQEKGLDLSQVEADPFNYPDGRYHVMLVEVEHLEPKQPGWAEQLKFVFEFITGQPVAANEKYVGREKHVYESIPTPEMFDEASEDDEKAKKVNAAIQRTVQRLTALGLSEEEIDALNVEEIHNKLRGRKYQFELVTGMARDDGKKPPQFVNNLRPLGDVVTTAADLLGEDDDEDA